VSSVRARLGGWKDRAVPPLPRLTGRQRWWLVAIVVLGAVLRFGWAAYATEEPTQLRDPVLYTMLGENLADGHGYSYLTGEGDQVPSGIYPSAYYPPGYPLFLGAVFWSGDHLLPFDVGHVGMATFMNALLSAATLPLVFALGRRLNGVTAGLVAAALMAVLPNTIFETGVVLTESLFLLLMVLMLLIALPTPALARAPGWRRQAVVGVLFALTALVRPVSLVLLPVFLYLWWPAGARVAMKRTGLVLGAAVLTILPWTIRNVITMDSPVLISTNLGDNLCIGYNSKAQGGFAQLPEACNRHNDIPRPRFETLRQSENIDYALTWARKHPAKLPSLVLWRGYYTLHDDHDGIAAVQDYGANNWMSPSAEKIFTVAADGFYFALSGFALVGVVAALRRRRDGAGRDRRQGFLVLTMALAILPPLLTFGDPRFKAPLYPLLAIYAALALVAATKARPAPEPEPERALVATDPAEDDGATGGSTETLTAAAT
jgi:4-amino-4-deoxy-L-arabinose transferase-like glycosyltransferase